MKAKGNLRITSEQLHKLLQLPEEVIITEITFDQSRDIATLLLRSEKPVAELTYKVVEGGVTPNGTHYSYEVL